MFKNPRTAAIADILAHRGVAAGARVLVVGCGSGHEAAVLADMLKVDVTGIDIVANFDAAAGARVRLQQGDATAMVFSDASFDVVFSYHALEHIPDYDGALTEMRRVLKPGGLYCIGTPNRSRLLGYVGGASNWKQKLNWNVQDLLMRLRGRFRNEFGAHAGYTAAELQGILRRHFATADDVSLIYYCNLYRGRQGLIKALGQTGLARIAFPSIYFVGA